MRRPDERWHAEDGGMTVFVVALSLALLMLAGLLYDGGRILAARREAFSVADNAARAGAQALDVDHLRTEGALRLDDRAATAAVADYLDRSGHTGEATVTETAVTVEVQITVPLVLLSAIGMEPRTVTGTGDAEAVRGVSAP